MRPCEKILPAHWAPALLHGDTRGLAPDEVAKIETWKKEHGLTPFRVAEETFADHFENQPTECATYHCIYADELQKLHAFLRRHNIAPSISHSAIAGPGYGQLHAWDTPFGWIIETHLVKRHFSLAYSDAYCDMRERLVQTAVAFGYFDPLDLLIHRANTSGKMPPLGSSPYCILRTCQIAWPAWWTDVIVTSKPTAGGKFLSPALQWGAALLYDSLNAAEAKIAELQAVSASQHLPLVAPPTYTIISVEGIQP